MNKQETIEHAKIFVQQELGSETTGHDYWHSLLVWRNAIHIGKTEHVDMFIVKLAAILHDVGDWKMNKGTSAHEEKIKPWLLQQHIPETDIDHILNIIGNLAYKGPAEKAQSLSKEGIVVQDADRLEALGAIGIARAFATGQKLGQEIYNPDIKPNINRHADEYKKQYTGERQNTSINHFYEKLLLIKDLMNTDTAKKIAEKRHHIMQNFLQEFFSEWNGES